MASAMTEKMRQVYMGAQRRVKEGKKPRKFKIEDIGLWIFLRSIKKKGVPQLVVR